MCLPEFKLSWIDYIHGLLLETVPWRLENQNEHEFSTAIGV